jgi:hypothetical protein
VKPKVVTARKATPPAPKIAAAPARAAPAKQASFAAPAPVRQKVVAQPVRVAAAPAPTAPRPTAQRPTTQRIGLSRGNMALIGVFGSNTNRYALVRMPNGSIERMGPGDSVQGVRVAAIGSDSVRLNNRGRDTLLRLPE